MTMDRTTEPGSGLSLAEELVYSERGRELVNQFHIMLRTAKLYEPSNNNFKRQLQQTCEIVDRLREQFGELVLQVRRGYYYLSGVRIRQNVSGLNAARELLEFIENLGISGFIFAASFTGAQMAAVVRALVSLEEIENCDYDMVVSRFQSERVESLIPLPPVEDEEDADDDTQKRKMARKIYLYAVANMKSLVEQINRDRPVNLMRTQRVVQKIVDQVVSDDSFLLELTALKTHDQYTYQHSTNVCIYSVALGTRLELNRVELARLGVAALFHDFGKTKLPIELINKPSELSADEWTSIRRHPIYGALSIAASFPFDERCCQAMLVAYEHHLNVDGTGYPATSKQRLPGLMSRIVAVADCFEAMTSGRAYRREPISPDKALQKMLMLAGTRLDALLFKAFVNVVSVYPPGTLLLLDTGEIAVATTQNSNDLLRPKAMLIGNRQGLFEVGQRIDLSERSPDGKSYARSIVTSVDPSRLSVDLGRYLLDEEATENPLLDPNRMNSNR